MKELQQQQQQQQQQQSQQQQRDLLLQSLRAWVSSTSIHLDVSYSLLWEMMTSFNPQQKGPQASPGNISIS